MNFDVRHSCTTSGHVATNRVARLRVRADFASKRDVYKQCGLDGLLDALWEPAHVWERHGKTENYPDKQE